MSQQHAQGVTELALDRNIRIPVGIVDKMIHEMIIGNDALMMGKAKIDYSTGKLEWFGQDWEVRRIHKIQQQIRFCN